MTLVQAQAKYDAILQSMGVSRTQYANRLTEFPVGDQRIAELEYLDGLITRLGNGPVYGSMCSVASFSRD